MSSYYFFCRTNSPKIWKTETEKSNKSSHFQSWSDPFFSTLCLIKDLNNQLSKLMLIYFFVSQLIDQLSSGVSAATRSSRKMLNLCTHSSLRECPEKGRRKKMLKNPHQKPIIESQSRNPIIHCGHHIYFSKQRLLYQHKSQIFEETQCIFPCMSRAEYVTYICVYIACSFPLLLPLLLSS